MTLFEFLVKKRRSIIIGTFIAGLLGAGVSLIISPKYEATSCIMPSLDMLGMGGFSQTGTSAMNMLQFLGGLAVTPADIYAELAQNNAVITSIIEKFRLDTIYKSEYREELLLKVAKHISAEATTSGFVYISYKDKLPERAAMLCNAIVDELDRLNRELIVTKGKKLRIFLGSRLKETEDSIRLYQDSLVLYQKRYGILDFESTVKAITETWQNMETEYFQTKLQYEYSKNEQGTNSKVTVNLKKKLDVLKREKDRLFNTAFDSIAKVPAIKKLPAIGAEYVLLQMMLQKYTEIYKLLTTEYEKAKIMEKQDTPTLQILYRAEVPKLRYWPKRKLITLFFMVIFFFVYTTLLVIVHAMTHDPKKGHTLSMIKNALKHPLGHD